MLTDFLLPLSLPEDAGSEQADVLARTERASAAAPNHFSGVVRVMGRAFRSGRADTLVLVA
jgi:hypothetical protein